MLLVDSIGYETAKKNILFYSTRIIRNGNLERLT